MFPVPMTPERDFATEGLPSYWTAEDETPQPRTPNVPWDNFLLRLASEAHSRGEISSRESEESERSQSPKPKRIKTPSQSTDAQEIQQRRSRVLDGSP